MEKSGQGPTHPDIISKDEIKSPLRRVVENFITVVCWGIYLYLMLPLFTLVLWVFGIRTIYDQIVGAGGYEGLLHLLKNGGITTLVIVAIIWGWARYNYLRFKYHGERRMSRVRITSDDEIGRWLGVESRAMAPIRSAHRLEVHIEKNAYRIIEQE